MDILLNPFSTIASTSMAIGSVFAGDVVARKCASGKHNHKNGRAEVTLRYTGRGPPRRRSRVGNRASWTRIVKAPSSARIEPISRDEKERPP